MDQTTRLIIFKAQTQNVQEIDKARVQIRRAINNAIRHGDSAVALSLTKTMALVFYAGLRLIFPK